MSSGQHHYREAERLLDEAAENVSMNTVELTGEAKADILAAAQVHATLALAAATAYPAVRDFIGTDSEASEWAGVTA